MLKKRMFFIRILYDILLYKYKKIAWFKFIIKDSIIYTFEKLELKLSNLVTFHRR